MELGLKALQNELKLLEELPEGRRVFLKTGRLCLEVDREKAKELLNAKIREVERLLRDTLEKIQAAFRALAEQDEARFRALAAEIALAVGVAPENRFDLEALERAIKAELEAI